MWKYFLLQLKRVFRRLPSVCLAVLILFCGLLLVLNGVMQILSDDASDTKMQIAIVGEAEDSYLEMGVTALQSFDSSRFAVDVLEMSEEEAKKALERGQIGAYVVIPEGFVEEALQGRVKTLKYVSTVGATGLVSMFKDEITTVISDIVLACQRGMYGIEGALSDAGYTGEYGSFMNDVSLSYVEFVLIRSKTYQVEALGIHDELGLEGYLFSGICVLFLTLTALPFAQLLIKQDLSLNKILASKRQSVISQTLCEFFSFFAGFAMLLLSVVALVSFGLYILPIDMEWLFANTRLQSILYLLPVALLVSSFAYLVFGFSSNLVGGVLLQFFVGVAACFISGCMYPLSFFPEALQKLAGGLPHSIARECVSGYLLGKVSGGDVATLLGYSLLFVMIAVLVRSLRMADARG